METSIQTYTPPVVPDNCSIIQLPARNLDATVERELALRQVRVIEVLNPFRPDERNVIEVEALDNESLGALLARVEYTVERFEASINGERVDSSEAWRTVVSAGQEVVLYPRAGGSSLLICSHASAHCHCPHHWHWRAVHRLWRNDEPGSHGNQHTGRRRCNRRLNAGFLGAPARYSASTRIQLNV